MSKIEVSDDLPTSRLAGGFLCVIGLQVLHGTVVEIVVVQLVLSLGSLNLDCLHGVVNKDVSATSEFGSRGPFEMLSSKEILLGFVRGVLLFHDAMLFVLFLLLNVLRNVGLVDWF